MVYGRMEYSLRRISRKMQLVVVAAVAATWCCRMSDPLSVVEAQLSSVESWPSDALIDVFLEEPRARLINRPAAFMYGNCVGVSEPVAFYNVCNGMHITRLKRR